MLIIANWKLNHTLLGAQDWIEAFFDEYQESDDISVALAPSFAEIPMVSVFLEEEDTKVQLFSQDVSAFEQGRYTGEVSAKQLIAYGVAGSIVGHSERREYQKETNNDVAQKVRQCLSVGITPVVAFSNMEQINNLSEQVDLSLVHVAYEPLDAIGSGNFADPRIVEDVLVRIDEQFAPLSSMYGGSVSADTVEDFLKIEIVSGFLVGSASKDPNDFLDLLDEINSLS